MEPPRCFPECRPWNKRHGCGDSAALCPCSTLPCLVPVPRVPVPVPCGLCLCPVAGCGHALAVARGRSGAATRGHGRCRAHVCLHACGGRATPHAVARATAVAAAVAVAVAPRAGSGGQRPCSWRWPCRLPCRRARRAWWLGVVPSTPAVHCLTVPHCVCASLHYWPRVAATLPSTGLVLPPGRGNKGQAGPSGQTDGHSGSTLEPPSGTVGQCAALVGRMAVPTMWLC